MDLSRRHVCFFVFLGVFVLEKVLPCELLSGRRLECAAGNVSSSDQCPKTCCFNTTAYPNCYFQENVYGPIRHSNGLCINVRDGSETLFWSKDCTSRNAFFLVSYDHPPYHIASGKCVLPGVPNAAKDNSRLVIRNDRIYCSTRSIETYRPTENGTLEYHFLRQGYDICIGGIDGSPKTNDYVYLSKKACQVENICQDALSYVYQRKFVYRRHGTMQCYLGQTIKIIIITWANSNSRKTTCVSTKATQLMQEKCDGKTTCTFSIRKADLGSCSGDSNTYFVRYTCKIDAKPAAPSALHVSARGQKKMLVGWSNDANRKYNILIKFEICYWQSHSTIPGDCSIVFSSHSLLTLTLYGLKPATKYNVTVARYSCDGNVLGIERRKIAITRSAALKTNGEKSATSFQIQLGTLQGDDKYVQIVVSKLRSNATPTDYPGSDLRPYDVKTVDSKSYVTAELTSNHVKQNKLFTIGEGIKYVGSGTRTRRSIDFQNVQLEPETYYSVFQRTFKSADLYYDSDWMDVIKTDKLSPTTPLTNMPEVATTKQSGGAGRPVDDDPDNGSSGGGSSSGSSTAIIGAAAGGAVLLIILAIFIIIFIRRRRRENKSSDTHPYDKPVKYKTSENKETVNEDQIQQNNPPSSDERDENPNVITAPSGDVHAKPIKKKLTPDSEQVEDEESTYTALKRPGPGEEENDVHLYAHLNEGHKDYVNQNPDKIQDDANYEDVENEASTYTALKRTGEEENDGHLYTHLNEVHTDYVNQNPDKIQDDANYEDVENEASTYTALKRTGEEENDGHLYTHLIEVHTDYVNQNPDKIQDDANYEDVENEASTYTALKRTGEEENDGHLYAHLTEVHTDYVIPKETGF